MLLNYLFSFSIFQNNYRNIKLLFIGKLKLNEINCSGRIFLKMIKKNIHHKLKLIYNKIEVKFKKV